MELKFFDATFWKIFNEKKLENSTSFLMTLFVNALAAVSEGASFGLILLALTALNGHFVARLENIAFIPWHTFSSQELFNGFIIAAILCQILRSALTYLGQKGMTRMSIRFQIAMEKRIYRKIFSFPFSHIHRYKSGDLVEAVQAPSKIYSILDAVNKAGVCILNMCALTTLLFFISPSMSCILCLLFGIIYVVQRIILKTIATRSSAVTKVLADFNHYTFQCLNGIKTIFTFNRQNYIHVQVEKRAQQVGEMSGRLFLLQFSLTPLNEILGIITVGVCVVVGPLFLAGSKDVILPSLLTFVTVAYRLATKVQAFIVSIGTVAYNWGSFFHLSNFLEEPEEKEIKELTFPGLEKSIEFRDVSLRYEGNPYLSVSRVSFSLPKGGFLALVGASGAGKSSMADLLIGLYGPVEGAIFVDGVDRSNYNINTWKERLGVVSQETFLLNSTVEENIRFGCQNVTDVEIQKAARQAHAHEFIEKLPMGYQTLLGTSGHSLSGGEKQRVALARVLLRRPEILILDEATSHLDSHSEKIIHETLSSFYREKTMIVIAHRLFTIKNADFILVMDEGKVVERGSHEELLGFGGRYAHFWGLQQSKSREEEYV